MKVSLRPWQLLVVAVMTALNCYAIAEGLKYSSLTGVLFALASLTALGFCIKIFRTMNRMAAEAEDAL
ncbi:hypothetical protein [Foetidibacter luteolus]|uniref:hypothetical protein n=1 Tax=Foetidibacter luteolus TaxID=2608880 RepID=UPI00129AC9AA|nr:hypothetical protein [Foetidibacter luteolus]